MDHLKDTELHHYCQGLKKNQLPSELLSNDQLRHLSQLIGVQGCPAESREELFDRGTVARAWASPLR